MKVTLVDQSKMSVLEIAEQNIKLDLAGMQTARRNYSRDICRYIRTIGHNLDNARAELKDDQSFGRWCKEKFGWSPSHLLRLREAGRVATALLEASKAGSPQKTKLGATDLPSNERQLRILADYSDDSDQVVEAWATICPDLPRNSNGEIRSASAIKKALAEHGFIDPPEPKPTPTSVPPVKKEKKGKFDPTSYLSGLTKKQALALAKAAQVYAESL